MHSTSISNPDLSFYVKLLSIPTLENIQKEVNQDIPCTNYCPPLKLYLAYQTFFPL